MGIPVAEGGRAPEAPIIPGGTAAAPAMACAGAGLAIIPGGMDAAGPCGPSAPAGPPCDGMGRDCPITGGGVGAVAMPGACGARFITGGCGGIAPGPPA